MARTPLIVSSEDVMFGSSGTILSPWTQTSPTYWDGEGRGGGRVIVLQNTLVFYNILQLLNQSWKHFASRLLMLVNRPLLFQPLLLDILILYLKLKITFTVCEIRNRMDSISLLEKFWNYMYFLLSKGRRNENIY